MSTVATRNRAAETATSQVATVPDFATPAARLTFETGLVAGRLAALLRATNAPEAADHLGMLERAYTAVAGDRDLETWPVGAIERRTDPAQPLDRLADAFGLAPAEIDLIVLAGLAEEHEGFSATLRALHPDEMPWPTLGLAARLMGVEGEARHALRALVCDGPAVRAGILRVVGDRPFFDRDVRLGPALWPALAGVDVLPDDLVRDEVPSVVAGLERWLDSVSVARAVVLLREGRRCAIVLSGGDELEDGAINRRALALAVHAGVAALPVVMAERARPARCRTLAIHAALRGAVPILGSASRGQAGPTPDDPDRSEADPKDRGTLPLEAFAGPVIVAGVRAHLGTDRPVVGVPVAPLTAADRSCMWQALLPSVAADQATANALAGQFPLGPEAAWAAVRDAELASILGDVPLDASMLADGLRVRAAAANDEVSAVRRRSPRADWDRLVVPASSRAQLQAAAERLRQQAQVLDGWGFLANRHGARGVRMLLAGPPGTGKTLAAEVLAHALGVDLLIVDLARLVSKWIGETEKNLATVFDAAERAHAVLLFDEADALFGRRTEISDANDRYANLETAYLLSRLERFDGLAVLTTNVRHNIDAAFVRRLEFIVDFDEPNRAARLALWRCHLPPGAPLAPDVDLEALASLYRLTGGLIKNASVAAAFLAAGEATPGCAPVITQDCFLRAIRREYDKAGWAFPGVPPTIG